MTDKPILTKTFNEELDVEGRVGEGYVLARIYLEVQGNDRDAAKEALERTVFDGLGHEPYIDLLEVKMYDLEKQESAVEQETEGGKKTPQEAYSGVVEIKLLARDFRWFVNVVMRYGPTAMEVMEPEEVHLTTDQIHSILADVSEISQMFSNQILSLLKDDERRMIYNRLLTQRDVMRKQQSGEEDPQE